VSPRRLLPRDWLALALVLCLAVAGCSAPSPTAAPPVSVDSPTLAVLPADTETPSLPPTDIPTPTLEGAANATPEASLTPAANDTPAVALATGTPSPTPAGPCTNNARFVADVTVPDGTQFLAGQPIDKQWRVRNIGTCDWGPDYRLVLVSGNALGAQSEVALYPARAGTEAILEVNMVAPPEPGSYTGRWQARSPTAKLFGDRVFVTVNVIVVTTTVTITSTPTNTPTH
jgi:hypothetical protein